MLRRVFWTILSVFIFSLPCFASEDDSIISDTSVSLLSTYGTSRIEQKDSVIYLYFNFNNPCPNYFYEILKDEKKIVFTFINTRLTGFPKEDTVKQLNLGPIKTMYLNEQIKNKNEAMNGLKPEFYYVTNVTLNCDPIIKSQESFDIIEKGQTLSITFNWPANKAKRKALYSSPHKKRTGLVLTLSGIGVVGLAGGGYLLWQFLNSDTDSESDVLQPVLPDRGTP